MVQTQISIEDVYRRLVALEKALQTRGIIVDTRQEDYKMDDEGELTEDFRKEIEKRRKSSNYVSHEEVKRSILAKK